MTERATADFSNSKNEGLQLGQNFGTVTASFNIAAGASVYMGKGVVIP